MIFSSGSIAEHYEALIDEYRADLERTLEIAAGSGDDLSGALHRMNRVLISEIARLKVQIIDMDLALARLSGGPVGVGIRPNADAAWASMPVYDAGAAISISAGVTTHGFHAVEAPSAGRGHRWSGPSTRSGFVAVINRAKPLIAEAVIVKIMHPRIEFQEVSVDGEAIRFEWVGQNRLRFVIPGLPQATEPVATQVSFLVSECVVVSEVEPQYSDHRKVGFSMTEVQLLEFKE